MLISRIPSIQYAISSCRLVLRFVTHDNLLAMLASWIDSGCDKYCMRMEVILLILPISDLLVPKAFHSASKNVAWFGATSSCRVQPRVNHELRRNDDIGERGSPVSGTSYRYAKQAAECLYHVNIELMASDNSALLVLSMQQVSIQTHSYPYSHAIRQQFRTLEGVRESSSIEKD